MLIQPRTVDLYTVPVPFRPPAGPRPVWEITVERPSPAATALAEFLRERLRQDIAAGRQTDPHALHGAALDFCSAGWPGLFTLRLGQSDLSAFEPPSPGTAPARTLILRAPGPYRFGHVPQG